MPPTALETVRVSVHIRIKRVLVNISLVIITPLVFGKQKIHKTVDKNVPHFPITV